MYLIYLLGLWTGEPQWVSTISSLIPSNHSQEEQERQDGQQEEDKDEEGSGERIVQVTQELERERWSTHFI